MWGCGKGPTDDATVTMDAFSSDDAEESTGTRPNFIGEVVSTAVESTDDRFQTQYENDIDVLYEIDVLDHDYENVFELGVNVRQSVGSKWMVLIGHLENIFGPETVRGWDSLEEMLDFLEGKVFEFKDQDFTADEEFTFEHKGDGHTLNFESTFGDLENPPNSMMLPVREVTDAEELADLGVETEAATEEVEF